MRKIGIIGGIGWASTQVYYQILNKKVHEALGGFNAAKRLLAYVELFKVIKR